MATGVSASRSVRRKRVVTAAVGIVFSLLVITGVFASNDWLPRTDGFSGDRFGWFGRRLPRNYAASNWNPIPPPSPTPQLSKEYIYAGSRLLAVEDANAPTPTPTPTPINVALAGNGGTASASSVHSSGYPATATNDGDRKGLNWASGGGWNDATSASFPDWLQIDFSAARTIGEIDVFTVQDSYGAPSEPTLTDTFTMYGVTDFDVQYWNGSAWATVTGGTVTGNDKVWRQFTFTPVSTTKIRVTVNSALTDYSRITELEAWGN